MFLSGMMILSLAGAAQGGDADDAEQSSILAERFRQTDVGDWVRYEIAWDATTFLKNGDVHAQVEASGISTLAVKSEDDGKTALSGSFQLKPDDRWPSPPLATREFDFPQNDIDVLLLFNGAVWTFGVKLVRISSDRETVTVMDRDFDCERIDFQMEHPDIIESSLSIWLSPEVPVGGIVKMTVDNKRTRGDGFANWDEAIVHWVCHLVDMGDTENPSPPAPEFSQEEEETDGE